mmetsp:Transcript_23680/g.73380  ORF Transcript_23680/g.73380 Transcript_23680/m.73380 type:complete len:769 (-) Transcript_23680:394-2700(-)
MAAAAPAGVARLDAEQDRPALPEEARAAWDDEGRHALRDEPRRVGAADVEGDLVVRLPLRQRVPVVRRRDELAVAAQLADVLLVERGEAADIDQQVLRDGARGGELHVGGEERVVADPLLHALRFERNVLDVGRRDDGRRLAALHDVALRAPHAARDERRVVVGDDGGDAADEHADGAADLDGLLGARLVHGPRAGEDVQGHLADAHADRGEGEHLRGGARVELGGEARDRVLRLVQGGLEGAGVELRKALVVVQLVDRLLGLLHHLRRRDGGKDGDGRLRLLLLEDLDQVRHLLPLALEPRGHHGDLLRTLGVVGDDVLDAVQGLAVCEQEAEEEGVVLLLALEHLALGPLEGDRAVEPADVRRVLHVLVELRDARQGFRRDVPLREHEQGAQDVLGAPVVVTEVEDGGLEHAHDLRGEGLRVLLFDARHLLVRVGHPLDDLVHEHPVGGPQQDVVLHLVQRVLNDGVDVAEAELHLLEAVLRLRLEVEAAHNVGGRRGVDDDGEDDDAARDVQEALLHRLRQGVLVGDHEREDRRDAAAEPAVHLQRHLAPAELPRAAEVHHGQQHRDHEHAREDAHGVHEEHRAEDDEVEVVEGAARDDDADKAEDDRVQCVHEEVPRRRHQGGVRPREHRRVVLRKVRSHGEEREHARRLEHLISDEVRHVREAHRLQRRHERVVLARAQELEHDDADDVAEHAGEHREAEAVDEERPRGAVHVSFQGGRQQQLEADDGRAVVHQRLGVHDGGDVRVDAEVLEQRHDGDGVRGR